MSISLSCRSGLTLGYPHLYFTYDDKPFLVRHHLLTMCMTNPSPPPPPPFPLFLFLVRHHLLTLYDKPVSPPPPLPRSPVSESSAAHTLSVPHTAPVPEVTAPQPAPAAPASAGAEATVEPKPVAQKINKPPLVFPSPPPESPSLSFSIAAPL